MGSGSVHVAVAKLVTWLVFSTNGGLMRERALAQIDEEADPAADPDDRILFARSVATGWVVLGFACGLLMVLLAYVGHVVGGSPGRTAGLAVGMGAVFFCVTGALYASWRMLRAYGLRAAVRRHGVDSPQAERASRRATPRNTSLLPQALAAAIAILLAAGG
jgi:hypothetical protein